MKQLKFILFTALTCLLCASSCKKNDEPKVWTELPPATQTGANTIGCLVNGKLWATSKLPSTGFSPAMAAFYTVVKPDSIVLDFYANAEKGFVMFRTINPKVNKKIDIDLLNCSFPEQINCRRFRNIRRGHIYLTKLDVPNGILSGTFEFEAQCAENDAVITHITEGRFDMYMAVLGKEDLKNK